MENIGVSSALLASAIGGRASPRSRKFNKSNGMCLPNVAVLFITL